MDVIQRTTQIIYLQFYNNSSTTYSSSTMPSPPHTRRARAVALSQTSSQVLAPPLNSSPLKPPPHNPTATSPPHNPTVNPPPHDRTATPPSPTPSPHRPTAPPQYRPLPHLSHLPFSTHCPRGFFQFRWQRGLNTAQRTYGSGMAIQGRVHDRFLGTPRTASSTTPITTR